MQEIKIPEATVCPECLFVMEIPREPVLLKNNPLAFLEYQDNVCGTCGHQKDGTTLPIVHERIRTIANRLNERNEAIWQFVQKYFELDEEERKDVCISVPRFMTPNFKSTGDQYCDEIEEPYSWFVVWNEVRNNTNFAKTLVLEWWRAQKEKRG